MTIDKLFSPSVYEHAAAFLGKTPWAVSRDADLLYQAHAAAYEYYAHQPITVGIDIYNLEAEAYGAVVDEPSGHNIPSISRSLYDDPTVLQHTPAFDPQSDGRIPLVLLAGARLKAAYPHADVRIPVSGPFSVASILLGLETLLCEALVNPDQLRLGLMQLAEHQLRFCMAIREAGLGATLFESAATPPLLSPDLFRQIALQPLRHLVRKAETVFGIAPALVIGGDTLPILEAILETGTPFIICPSETDQPAFMRQMEAHPQIMVRINMDPARVAFGTPDDLKQEVKRVFALKGHRQKACIGTGVLPFDTKPENVKMIRSLLHEMHA